MLIAGHFGDLPVKEDPLLRNARCKFRVDLGEGFLLLLSHRGHGGALFESVHGEFVGRFHKVIHSTFRRNAAGNLWIARRTVCMESLPMSTIRLLSTDFDGTLTDTPHGQKCVPSLAVELEAVARQGAIWVVNTGRPLVSALEGIESLEAPVQPEYILTSERHIYKPDGLGGWHDYGEWNQVCREHHDLLFKECGHYFNEIEELVGRYDGVVFQESVDGVPSGLIAPNEGMLDELISELKTLSGRPEDFHYQRSNIYLRFCHRRYDKGSSLAELSRLLDMPTSNILAVGDHQNDLAMLFGSVAAMVACPSNAHPSVKEAVIQAGGHVSLLEAGEGTAEAIHLYRTGKKKPLKGQ